MIKGEKLIYRSDEGTYDGREYSFLEVWMRKNKSTYIKVWFGKGRYSKYELQPLLDAFIKFLESSKMPYIDTDSSYPVEFPNADHTVNKEDTNNEKED